MLVASPIGWEFQSAAVSAPTNKLHVTSVEFFCHLVVFTVTNVGKAKAAHHWQKQ
jgi:hypothetical protein